MSHRYDSDELRLLAMLEHPHQAEGIADLPDEDIERIAAEHDDENQ